jgi:hypothetical protein
MYPEQESNSGQVNFAHVWSNGKCQSQTIEFFDGPPTLMSSKFDALWATTCVL